jgi:copper transport protein
MRWNHVVVGAATALAVLVPAQQALAHAGLEASAPAANAVLESGPPNIVLQFDEAVDASLAEIELFDQTATLIPLGGPESVNDGATVQASVPTLPEGVYVVVWRVPSDDGHVTNGVFSFQVGVKSGVDVGALIDRVSGTAAADPVVRRLDTAARLVALIGVIVLLGGGVLALQAGESSTNKLLLWLAWAYLLAGTLGSFGLYGARVVAGSVSDALEPSVWSKVAGTHTASMLFIRVVLILMAGVLLLSFARRANELWRGAALVVGAALVLTFSTIGHANTQSPRALWIAVDIVHLGAIALWIGGLAMLAFGGRAWLADAEAEPIVRRFSVVATVAVPVIVVTGVAQALKLAGGLDDITGSSWGKVLLVKVALVTVLVAIGGVSQWMLRHHGQSALKRTVMIEALFGIAIVGLAAGLVSLPPRVVAASKVFTASLTAQGLIADVTVTPGRVGLNEVHLVITPPGGSITPVVSTTVQAELPSAGIGFVAASLQSTGPNHYTGTIQLSEAGRWTLQIIVEASPGQTVTTSAEVVIPG